MAVADLAPVPQAIFEQTGDPRLIEALLLGSSFEGGWGPAYGVGDAGNSYGPYQLNLPYHQDLLAFAQRINPNITSLQEAATDPQVATAYAIQQLGYPQTVAGAGGHGYSGPTAGEWSSNPELAAEQAATAAEGPASSYLSSYGQPTLDQHWQQVLGVIAQAQRTGQLAPGAGYGVQPGGIVTGNLNANTDPNAQPGGAASAVLTSVPGPFGGGGWLPHGIIHDIAGYWGDAGKALSETGKLAGFVLSLLENLPQFLIRGLEIWIGFAFISGSVVLVVVILATGSPLGRAILGAAGSLIPGAGKVLSLAGAAAGQRTPTIPQRRPARPAPDTRHIFVQEQGRNYRAYLRAAEAQRQRDSIDRETDSSWRAYNTGRDDESRRRVYAQTEGFAA